MWYRILFVKNLDFKRRRDVLSLPNRIFLGKFIDAMLWNFKVGQNALIQATRKVSLINSVYTYTNNFTFTAGFDQPTTGFKTKSSNLHVAVSQMRAVVLVDDKIQANCKETCQDIATCHAVRVSPNIRRF